MTLCRFQKTVAIPLQIYFRFPVLWRLTLTKLKLSAYQISTTYLNPRPRYQYFRLLITNICHIESLFPVSILTYSPSSACGSALAYKILYELDDQWQSYDVISIVQDGSHSVENLLPVFGCGQVLHLRRSKTIGIPNLDQISQSMAETNITIVSWPTPFEKRRLWPIFSHNVSTAGDSEKSSITTNIKSTTGIIVHVMLA